MPPTEAIKGLCHVSLRLSNFIGHASLAARRNIPVVLNKQKSCQGPNGMQCQHQHDLEAFKTSFCKQFLVCQCNRSRPAGCLTGCWLKQGHISSHTETREPQQITQDTWGFSCPLIQYIVQSANAALQEQCHLRRDRASHTKLVGGFLIFN